jgi:hypothetical protein
MKRAIVIAAISIVGLSSRAPASDLTLNVGGDINADRDCIGPGTNGTLDTVASGDDVVAGTQIWDGADRTCNTAKSGDDQQFRAVGNVEPNPLTRNWDWNTLQYDFQSTTDFEDGTHSPIGEQRDLDLLVYQQALAADLELLQGWRRRSSRPDRTSPTRSPSTTSGRRRRPLSW